MPTTARSPVTTPEIMLIPATHDAQDGNATSGGSFWFPAKIDAGVAKSGALTGGSVTIAALAALAAVPYGPKQNVAAPTALPENVELLDAADIDKFLMLTSPTTPTRTRSSCRSTAVSAVGPPAVTATVAHFR